MDLFSSLILFIGIGVILFVVTKRYEAQKIGATRIKEQMMVQQQKEDEQSRRNQIIDKVENFLKGSEFVEPIAKWREEDVYKYVFKDGYLYEFDDIMSEANQKIGMDEDFLCFKRLSYKRVADPSQFLDKFKISLGKF